LLLLRGRGERQLLTDLPHRTGPAAAPAGVSAAVAYAQPVAPLPPPPDLSVGGVTMSG
jgi:hypothetical protein